VVYWYIQMFVIVTIFCVFLKWLSPLFFSYETIPEITLYMQDPAV